MNKTLLRSLSLILAGSFLIQDISWAAPAISSLATPKELWQTPSKIQISSEYGRIRDSFKGEQPKLLIHIQDAHTNFSAQENISNILEELIKKHAIKTVFLEGGTKDDSLSFLRPLAPAVQRKQVAKKYLLNGLISGAEYLDLSSDHPLSLIGVEEEKLYFRNLNAYAAVARDRERTLGYLGEISERVSSLKRRMYPAGLLELDDFVQKFERNEKSFSEYFDLLRKQAREAGVNLLGYPHFLSLSELQNLESDIDFERANESQIAAIRFLKENGFDLKSASHPDKARSKSRSVLRFYADLTRNAVENGFDPAALKDLLKYTDYLRNFESIDPEALEREVREIRTEIYRYGLKNESLRLYEISEALVNLKTLFSLRATRGDFDEYLNRKKEGIFHGLHILAFLNKKLLDFGNDTEVLPFEPILEEGEKNIEDFYQATTQRDEVMVQKALKKMDENKISSAVLITGGYHTQNLKELMRAHKVSYAVVSPNVREETNTRRYEKLLLSEIDPKGLPKKSGTFAAAGDPETLACVTAVESKVARVIPPITAEFSHGARLAGKIKKMNTVPADPAKMLLVSEPVLAKYFSLQSAQKNVIDAIITFSGMDKAAAAEWKKDNIHFARIIRNGEYRLMVIVDNELKNSFRDHFRLVANSEYDRKFKTVLRSTPTGNERKIVKARTQTAEIHEPAAAPESSKRSALTEGALFLKYASLESAFARARDFLPVDFYDAAARRKYLYVLFNYHKQPIDLEDLLRHFYTVYFYEQDEFMVRLQKKIREEFRKDSPKNLIEIQRELSSEDVRIGSMKETLLADYRADEKLQHGFGPAGSNWQGIWLEPLTKYRVVSDLTKEILDGLAEPKGYRSFERTLHSVYPGIKNNDLNEVLYREPYNLKNHPKFIYTGPKETPENAPQSATAPEKKQWIENRKPNGIFGSAPGAEEFGAKALEVLQSEVIPKLSAYVSLDGYGTSVEPLIQLSRYLLSIRSQTDVYKQIIRYLDISRSRGNVTGMAAEYVLHLLQSESFSPDEDDRPPFMGEGAESIIKEFHSLMERHEKWLPAVVVFGSARIGQGHPYYSASMEVGKELWRENMPVRTGAAHSMMEGPMLGYTRERPKELAGDPRYQTQGVRIDLPFEQTVNPYVDDVIIFDYFLTRKIALWHNSIGAIAMPGGVGTMDETFEVWRRGAPLVFFGKDFWEPILSALRSSWERYGLEKDIERRGHFLVTDDPKEAVRYIKSKKEEHRLFTERKIDLNDVTGQVGAGLMKVKSMPKAVSFIGKPRASQKFSAQLETASLLAERLASAGSAVRIGSRDVLLNAIMTRAGNQGWQKKVQAVLYFPKGSSLTPNEKLLENHLVRLQDESVHQLVHAANTYAYVFLPGGVGTMNKLFDLLQIMQLNKTSLKPIILIGKDFWEPIISGLRTQMVAEDDSYWDLGRNLKKISTVDPNDFDRLIRIVDDADSAMEVLALSGVLTDIRAGARLAEEPESTKKTAGYYLENLFFMPPVTPPAKTARNYQLDKIPGLEEYQVKVSESDRSDGDTVLTSEIIEVSGNKDLVSSILMTVDHDNKLVYIDKFYPHFPSKKSPLYSEGRGRRLLYELVRKFDGYEVIAIASDAFQKSFKKMGQEYGFESVMTELEDKEALREVIKVNMNIYRAISISSSAAWSSATIYGVIRDNAAGSADRGASNSKRLLVLDDRKSFSEAVKGIYRNEYAQIDVVSNLEDAVSVIRNNPKYDLAILDVDLSSTIWTKFKKVYLDGKKVPIRKAGFEFAKWLANDEKAPQTILLNSSIFEKNELDATLARLTGSSPARLQREAENYGIIVQPKSQTLKRSLKSRLVATDKGSSGARLSAGSKENKSLLRGSILGFLEQKKTEDPERFFKADEIWTGLGGEKYSYDEVYKILDRLAKAPISGVERRQETRVVDGRNRTVNVYRFSFSPSEIRWNGLSIDQMPGSDAFMNRKNITFDQYVFKNASPSPKISLKAQKEALYAYEFLRTNEGAFSLGELYQELAAHFGESPALEDLNEFRRALEWLDQGGFPILRSNQKWSVEGISRDIFIVMDPDQWTLELKNAWKDLDKNESPQAIGQRIKIILRILKEIYGLTASEQFEIANLNKINKLIEGKAGAVQERLDQQLEKIQKKLGIAAVQLRTGKSRSLHSIHVHKVLHRMTTQQAYRALRNLTGKSRRTIAEELKESNGAKGNDLRALSDLESGESENSYAPQKWPKLAWAYELPVQDVFYLVARVSRDRALKFMQAGSWLRFNRFQRGQTQEQAIGQLSGTEKISVPLLSMIENSAWHLTPDSSSVLRKMHGPIVDKLTSRKWADFQDPSQEMRTPTALVSAMEIIADGVGAYKEDMKTLQMADSSEKLIEAIDTALKNIGSKEDGQKRLAYLKWEKALLTLRSLIEFGQKQPLKLAYFQEELLKHGRDVAAESRNRFGLPSLAEFFERSSRRFIAQDPYEILRLMGEYKSYGDQDALKKLLRVYQENKEQFNKSLDQLVGRYAIAREFKEDMEGLVRNGARLAEGSDNKGRYIIPIPQNAYLRKALLWLVKPFYGSHVIAHLFRLPNNLNQVLDIPPSVAKKVINKVISRIPIGISLSPTLSVELSPEDSRNIWSKTWQEELLSNRYDNDPMLYVRLLFLSIFSLNRDSDQFKRLYSDLVGRYLAARRTEFERRGIPATVERIEIPWSGEGQGYIPAYLSLPENRPAKGVPIVILFHGLDSVKEDPLYDREENKLLKQGVAVLRVDSLRHGENDAAFVRSEAEVQLFIRSVIGYLTDPNSPMAGRIDPDQIGVLGLSLGGYLALKAVADSETGRHLKGAVAINPPLKSSFREPQIVLGEYRDVLAHTFGILPDDPERDTKVLRISGKLAFTEEEVRALSRTAVRALLFLSENDPVISEEDRNALKTIAKKNPGIRIYSSRKTGHHFMEDYTRLYRDSFYHFIALFTKPQRESLESAWKHIKISLNWARAYTWLVKAIFAFEVWAISISSIENHKSIAILVGIILAVPWLYSVYHLTASFLSVGSKSDELIYLFFESYFRYLSGEPDQWAESAARRLSAADRNALDEIMSRFFFSHLSNFHPIKAKADQRLDTDALELFKGFLSYPLLKSLMKQPFVVNASKNEIHFAFQFQDLLGRADVVIQGNDQGSITDIAIMPTNAFSGIAAEAFLRTIFEWVTVKGYSKAFIHFIASPSNVSYQNRKLDFMKTFLSKYLKTPTDDALPAGYTLDNSTVEINLPDFNWRPENDLGARLADDSGVIPSLTIQRESNETAAEALYRQWIAETHGELASVFSHLTVQRALADKIWAQIHTWSGKAAHLTIQASQGALISDLTMRPAGLLSKETAAVLFRSLLRWLREKGFRKIHLNITYGGSRSEEFIKDALIPWSTAAGSVYEFVDYEEAGERFAVIHLDLLNPKKTLGSRLSEEGIEPIDPAELSGYLEDYISTAQRYLSQAGIRLMHAFLFGSRARGDSGAESDVDVGLITDRGIDAEIRDGLRALWKSSLPLDLIVYSMDELAQYIAQVHLDGSRIEFEEFRDKMGSGSGALEIPVKKTTEGARLSKGSGLSEKSIELEQVLKGMLSGYDRPEPEKVLELIRKYDVSPQDVLEVWKGMGHDPPEMKNTLKEIQNIVPHFFEIIDKISREYPNHELIFLARDAQYLYDAFKVVYSALYPERALRMIPASSPLVLKATLHTPDNELTEYLSSIGISQEAIISGKKFIFIDSGFNGSIAETLSYATARTFGYQPEELIAGENPVFRSFVVSTGEGKGASAKQIIDDRRKIRGVGAWKKKFPKTYKLAYDSIHGYWPGFIESELRRLGIDYLLAVWMQTAPHFHGMFKETKIIRGERKNFHDTRAPITTDIDNKKAFNNDAPVNPAAALIMQIELIRETMRVLVSGARLADEAATRRVKLFDPREADEFAEEVSEALGLYDPKYFEEVYQVAGQEFPFKVAVDSHWYSVGSLIRLGPLVFLPVSEMTPLFVARFLTLSANDPGSADRMLGKVLEPYKIRLGSLFDEYRGNIYFTPTFSAVPKMPVNPYQAALLSMMMAYADDFENAAVLDAGAGHGLLTSAALSLGGRTGELLENERESLNFARSLLGFYGWQPENNFITSEFDLSDGISLPRLGASADIGIANIGPWDFYHDANMAAIRLFSRRLNLRVIYNGGYSSEKVGHYSAFEAVKSDLEEQGYSVDWYLQRGIIFLRAENRSRGIGARLSGKRPVLTNHKKDPDYTRSVGVVLTRLSRYERVNDLRAVQGLVRWQLRKNGRTALSHRLNDPFHIILGHLDEKKFQEIPRANSVFLLKLLEKTPHAEFYIENLIRTISSADRPEAKARMTRWLQSTIQLGKEQKNTAVLNTIAAALNGIIKRSKDRAPRENAARIKRIMKIEEVPIFGKRGARLAEGDGLMQTSYGSKALAEIIERAKGEDGAEPLRIQNFDEVKSFIRSRIEVFRNSAENPEEKEEILKDSEEALNRLETFHENGKIRSIPAIILDQRDYALGYADSENMVVAHEALKFDIPLLSLYLFYLALYRQKVHWQNIRTLNHIFTDGEKKLKDALKVLVLGRVTLRNGVDHSERILSYAASNPHLTPLLIDESSFANRPYLDKEKVYLVYGSWEEMRKMYSSLTRGEKDVKRDMRLLIDPVSGVTGFWGVPNSVQRWIKGHLKDRQTPSTIDLEALMIVATLRDRNYPDIEEWTNSLLTGEPVAVSDEVFQRLMTLALKNYTKKRRLSSEKSRNNEYAEGQKIDNDLHAEMSAIVRLKDYFDPDVFVEHLRRFMILPENGKRSKEISNFLDSFYNNEPSGVLWKMYADKKNDENANRFFREQILDMVDYRGTFLGKVRQMLLSQDETLTAKAMDILVRKKFKGDELISLIRSGGSNKERIAAYSLLCWILFGGKDASAREGIGRWESPLLGDLQKDAEAAFYYLFRMDELYRKGGAMKSSADRRIIGLTIALDRFGGYPGEKGYTWFTSLRQRAHQSLSKKDLQMIRRVLLFWTTLNKNVIAEEYDGLVSGAYKSIGAKNTRRYSVILNKMFGRLRKEGLISEKKDGSFMDEILRLDEEKVAEELRNANKTAEEQDLSDVENMLRLYYALSEKYSVVWNKVLEEIQAKTDDPRDRGSRKEKLKNALGHAVGQYESLLTAIENSDDRAAMIALSELMELIRKRFLSVSEKEYRDDESDESTLLKLHQNLRVYGMELLSKLLHQEIERSKSLSDLSSSTELLAAFGKFIHASGLGGVDFEQLLTELEHGDLSYSQLHDLVRALRTETHKITRRLNEDMRLAMLHIWERSDLDDLRDAWEENAKTKVKIMGKGKSTWEKKVLTEEGKRDIEDEVVNELLRDTGIQVLESALDKFETILESDLTQENDATIRKVFPEPDPEHLDEHFFRFGQSEREARPELLSLWSKKGLNLIKMTDEGIAVPPGVILSAKLMTHPEIFKSPQFIERVQTEIDRLKKYSKYPDLKLLLYARSGSAFMLPGLLMTIPNVGMNDAEAEDLAQKTGDAWFAYDTYGEFIRSFAVNILGIPEEPFNEALDIYNKDGLSAEDLKEGVEKYKAIVKAHGAEIPEKMIDQVMMAVEKVYASWDSADAKAYRAKNRISQKWGTVVILQKGVFGNLNEMSDGQVSGTGTGILRQLPDGREVVQGRFRFRSIGEQLMSRADQNYILLSEAEKVGANEQSLEVLQPEIHKEIVKAAQRLKEIFRYGQMFEFTVERGKVWITQSNDDLVTVNYPEFSENESVQPLARGHGVSGGAIRGWAANTIEKAAELAEKYDREKPDDIDGVILLVDRVNPEFVNRIPKGVHLLAKTISVHAETLAQKYGITAVYGVPEMTFDEGSGVWRIGAEVMENGKIISMDGHENQLVYHNSGKIFVGSIPLKSSGARLAEKQEQLVNLKTDNFAPYYVSPYILSNTPKAHLDDHGRLLVPDELEDGYLNLVPVYGLLQATGRHAFHDATFGRNIIYTENKLYEKLTQGLALPDQIFYAEPHRLDFPLSRLHRMNQELAEALMDNDRYLEAVNESRMFLAHLRSVKASELSRQNLNDIITVAAFNDPTVYYATMNKPVGISDRTGNVSMSLDYLDLLQYFGIAFVLGREYGHLALGQGMPLSTSEVYYDENNPEFLSGAFTAEDLMRVNVILQTIEYVADRLGYAAASAVWERMGASTNPSERLMWIESAFHAARDASYHTDLLGLFPDRSFNQVSSQNAVPVITHPPLESRIRRIRNFIDRGLTPYSLPDKTPPTGARLAANADESASGELVKSADRSVEVDVRMVRVSGEDVSVNSKIWEKIDFANAEDAEDIYDLSRELPSPEDAGYLSQGVVAELILTKNDGFGRDAEFLVYREQGRVLAYLAGRYNPKNKIAEILQIVTHKKFQEKGIAKALHARYMWIMEMRHGEVKFSEEVENPIAENIPRAFGFKRLMRSGLPSWATNQDRFRSPNMTEDEDLRLILEQTWLLQVNDFVEFMLAAPDRLIGQYIERADLSIWIGHNQLAFEDSEYERILSESIPKEFHSRIRGFHRTNPLYYRRSIEILSLMFSKKISWNKNGEKLPDDFDIFSDLSDAFIRYWKEGFSMREKAFYDAEKGDPVSAQIYLYLKERNQDRDFDLRDLDMKIKETESGIFLQYGDKTQNVSIDKKLGARLAENMLGKITPMDTGASRHSHGPDDYIRELLEKGELDPLNQAIEIGIGLDEKYLRNPERGYGPAPTLIELFLNLREMNPNVRFTGIDINPEAVDQMTHYLSKELENKSILSRFNYVQQEDGTIILSTLKNLEVIQGGFEKPAELYPGTVDLIRVANVSQYYSAKQMKDAREKLALALRPNGILMIVSNGYFVTYRKSADGKLVPHEFSYWFGIHEGREKKVALKIMTELGIYRKDTQKFIETLIKTEKRISRDYGDGGEKASEYFNKLGYQTRSNLWGYITFKLDEDGSIHRETEGARLAEKTDPRMARLLEPREANYLFEEVSYALNVRDSEEFATEYQVAGQIFHFNSLRDYDDSRQTLARLGSLVFLPIREITPLFMGNLLTESWTDPVYANEKLQNILNLYRSRLDSVFDEYQGNIIFTPSYSAVHKMPVNPYQMAHLAMMMAYADDFEGAKILDAGAGHGLLSLGALSLGGRTVELLESDPADLNFASSLIRAYGWAPENDFITSESNLSDEVFFPQQGRTADIGIANIGPWDFYGDANFAAIRLFSRRLNLRVIYNGGYYFRDGLGHEAKFEAVISDLEQQGYYVDWYNQRGMGFLRAEKKADVSGARLGEEQVVSSQKSVVSYQVPNSYSLIPSTESIGSRLALALKPRTKLLVPVLLSAIVTLFTLTPAQASTMNIDAIEVNDFSTITGPKVYQGSVDIAKVRETAKVSRGSANLTSEASDAVTEEKMRFNAAVSAQPEGIQKIVYPTDIEAPVSLFDGQEKLQLALAGMKAVKEIFPNSITRFYLTGTEGFDGARLSVIQNIIAPYGDFVFLGKAPRDRVTARLVNTEQAGAEAMDGTIQLPVEPEREGSILGRAVFVIAKGMGLLLQKDGKFATEELTAESISDSAETLYNVGSAERADKAAIRDITSGVAKAAVLIRHRLLPALKELINEISVLANLRRAFQISA